MPETRKLRVFLCHASQDKPVVRELYQQLLTDSWIDPWLDEEKLLPGQDWNMEIEKAVESTDAVILCLSNNSVSKEGYVQKEIRMVINLALQKPEGTIYIIPVRFNNCEIPRSLGSIQYIDFFPQDRRSWAYDRLLRSLIIRAENLGVISGDDDLSQRNVQDPISEKKRAQMISNESVRSFVPSESEYSKPAISIEYIGIGYSSKATSLQLGVSRLASKIRALGYKVVEGGELSSLQLGLGFLLRKVTSGNSVSYGNQACLAVITFFQDLGLLSRTNINLAKDVRLENKSIINIIVRDSLIFGDKINL